MTLLNYKVEYETDYNSQSQNVFGAFLSDLNLAQTPVNDLKIEMQLEGKIIYEKVA